MRAGSAFVDLRVRVSDKRATTPSYEPDTRDSQIRDEIEEIAAADGLIMVLDSRLGREEANLKALEQLRRDLASRGIELASKAVVFQANKRDLEDIITMDWVRENFTTQRCAYVESSAMQHTGTLEAVRAVLHLTNAIQRIDRA